MPRDPADLFAETCATGRSEMETLPDLGHGNDRPTYRFVCKRNEELRKRIAELEAGIVKACGYEPGTTIEPLAFLRNHLHSLTARGDVERVVEWLRDKGEGELAQMVADGEHWNG